jgi:hypothetical protein
VNGWWLWGFGAVMADEAGIKHWRLHSDDRWRASVTGSAAGNHRWGDAAR